MGAFSGAMPAAAQAQWRAEAIPSHGNVGLLDLAFDSRGRGMLSWEGFEQHGRGKLTALDLRDPAGSWQRAPDLAGLTWGGAEIGLYARTRALLVAGQPTSGEDSARFRLVYAPGTSDGSFHALRTLADDVAQHVSAVNRAGDALVAYNNLAGRTWVAERTARHAFSRPRRMLPGGVGAVAINDADDRVLAWWGRDGVYARVRRAGGRWGRAVRVVRVGHNEQATIRAAITPRGRVILAWYAPDFAPEDRPVRIVGGVAIRTRAGWRSFTVERSTVTSGPFLIGTSAIPVIDSSSRVYVTWTGVVRGAPAVKLARITTRGPRGRVVLSRAMTGVGSAVDDAAAGPHGSLAVSWSEMTNYTTISTYASLRRGSGPFAPPEQLTPEGIGALTGSRVAFQPLTGEAVVAWGYPAPDGTGAVRASVSPGL